MILIESEGVYYTRNTDNWEAISNTPPTVNDYITLGISNFNEVYPYLSELPNYTIYTISQKEELYADLEYLSVTNSRYQISVDGNTFLGFNNTTSLWESDYMMTKAEIETISTSSFNILFPNSVYEKELYIRIYINSDNLKSFTVRSLSVEYTPNQGPVILNPIITPDSVHAEFAMLKGTLKDLEGDSIEYRVLIKKAGDVDYSVVNDWLAVSNNHNINRGYNQPYFNLGINNIKIEARDSRGVITSWIGNLVMTNEKPVFNFTYNEFGLEGTINDTDIDNVAVRVLIDDVEVQPWTTFFSVPAQYSYEWDTKYTPIGQTCNVKVQIKDTFEDITEYTFSVVGKYKGLLFVNKDGQYFTTDKGSILQMLDFKRLIAGECTPAEKLTLINQSNYNISDIDIIADKGNLPDIATVEFSLSQEPFTPLNKINISEVMAKDATQDVFVRVNSTLGRGIANGEFDIKVSGKIVR